MEVLTCDHPDLRPVRMSDLETLDFDFCRGFFNACFSDPSEFTFIFVGNVDPGAFVPLLNKYIASLPTVAAPGSAELPPGPIFRDTVIEFPRARQRGEVRHGQSPRSSVVVALPCAIFGEGFNPLQPRPEESLSYDMTLQV